MRFRIDPSPEETQRACQALATAAMPRSHAAVITLAVYALVGAAAWWVAPAAAGPVVLVVVGGVMLALVLLQLDGRRRTRAVMAADPHAREPHFVEVTADGIRAWCAHVDTRYTWDGVQRVLETPEFILFLRGGGGGPALPKRVIPAELDGELRAGIRAWSPDRGELLA